MPWCRSRVAVLVILVAATGSPARGGQVTFDDECGTKQWLRDCNGVHRNWNPDGLPGVNDDVTIPAGVGPVTAGAGGGTTAISVKSLQAPGGLRLGSVDLSLLDASSITGFEFFDTVVQVSTIGDTPGLSMSGTSVWGENATLQGLGSAATIFRNLGQLQMTGNGAVVSARFENEAGGTVTQRRSLSLATNATAENRGTWGLNGNNADLTEQVADGMPDGAVFTNAGVLRNAIGENRIQVGLISTQAGRIDADAGILRIQREASLQSTVAIATGARVSMLPPVAAPQRFLGTVRVNGRGILELVGGTGRRHLVEGSLLNQLGIIGEVGNDGFTLLQNANVEIAEGAELVNQGLLELGGPGSSTVSGLGTLSNGTTESAALLRISSVSTITAPVQSLGSIDQRANLVLGNGSPQVTSAGDWVLRDCEIQRAAAGPLAAIVTSGSLRTANGSTSSRVLVRVDVSGSGKISAVDGTTLRLSGGGTWTSRRPAMIAGALDLGAETGEQQVYRVASDADLESGDPSATKGPRLLSIRTNATLQIDASLATPLRVQFQLQPVLKISLRGGAIAGPGLLVNGDHLELSSGRLGIPGGRLRVLSLGSIFVLNGQIELRGTMSTFRAEGGNLPSITINPRAGLMLVDESVVENRGSLFLIGGAEIRGAGSVRNDDTVLKVDGETSTIAVPFDSSGTVAVETGILDLSGGVAQVQGTALTGGMWLVGSQGQLIIRGAAIDTIGPNASVVLDGEQAEGSAFEKVSEVSGKLKVASVLRGSAFRVNAGGRVATGTGSGNRQRRSGLSPGTPVPAGAATHFELSGGTFENDGSLLPGDEGEIGSFGINGAFAQGPGGSLHIDIGAAEHDQLVISGAAMLGGALEVELLDGFVPQAGDSIVVLTASTIAGQFANATDRAFTSAGAFAVTYDGSSVILSGFDSTAPTRTVRPATPTPTFATPAPTPSAVSTASTATPTPTIVEECIGDCNGDGAVRIGELITAVNIALGKQSVDTCAAADANGDGAIRIAELIAAVRAALDGCS